MREDMEADAERESALARFGEAVLERLSEAVRLKKKYPQSWKKSCPDAHITEDVIGYARTLGLISDSEVV